MEPANRFFVDRRRSPRRSCRKRLERLEPACDEKWDHRFPRRTPFPGRMDFARIWTGSVCGSSFSKQPLVFLGDPRGGGFTGVGQQKESFRRMITVGINYSHMHDSSACIVRDGELLFAVAEER